MKKRHYTEQELLDWMGRLNIFPKDIVEQFIRSSGKGGQNVNKVETCVVLKHQPTGIQVRCEAERVQSLNRQLGKILLLEKIENFYNKERLARIALVEKKKRQQRQRPKALKEKILKHKRFQSEKKSLRLKVKTSEE